MMLGGESVKTSSLKGKVSAEEWRARVELAAAYRLVAHWGWTTLIYNHISARVPGVVDQFLLNPLGLAYEEITASSLVKVDLDGRILLQPDHGLGVNHLGFIIHSAIHGARHDLTCVAHTHTVANEAVSATEGGLLPLSNSAMLVLPQVRYHEWEGPSDDPDERARIVQHLGDGDMLILRHHGLLVGGRTVGEAMRHLWFLARACEVQVAILSSGSPTPPPQAALRKAEAVAANSKQRRSASAGASPEWPALLRLADKIDASYAT